MTTAAERLLSLAGATGTAAALLLTIGAGATTGAALVDYSGLSSGTAAEHILVEHQADQPAGGGVLPPKPVTSATRFVTLPAATPNVAIATPNVAESATPSALTSAPTSAPTFPHTKVGADGTGTGAPPVLTENRADFLSKPSVSEAPTLIAAHFDIEQLVADTQTAALLQRQRNDEALLLILAIAESL